MEHTRHITVRKVCVTDTGTSQMLRIESSPICNRFCLEYLSRVCDERKLCLSLECAKNNS